MGQYSVSGLCLTSGEMRWRVRLGPAFEIDHAQSAKTTVAPAKSLIRMFGPRGNPQAKNLFAVIGYLQKKTRVHLRVAA